MATGQLAPENVQLHYGFAKVFERADTQSPAIARLETGAAFTVLGTRGEYYQVRLADGTLGFVGAHNLDGSHLPLTTNEQDRADERAAAAARPPGGWRGVLNRVRRLR